MKRLILHIGTHKTGSTALQEFLNDNRELLAQAGIYFAPSNYKYQGTSRLRNASFLVRYAKMVLDPTYGMPDWTAVTAGCIKDFKAAVEKHDTVLLTDERLWFQGAAYRESWIIIKELLDDLGVEDVRFIVYLRRQDQFIASLWNQYVKENTRQRTSLERYAHRKRTRMAMDYLGGLQAIEEAFGAGCVDVRVYERSRLANGDVRRDFCDALGIDAESFSFENDGSNPGISSMLAEIKREANRVQVYREADNFLRDPAITVSELSDKSTKALTAELSERILAPYLDGNARIAREYLHREDGVLFKPVKPAEPGEEREATLDEQTREVVHFFTAALVQERDARLDLERRVGVLEPQVRVGIGLLGHMRLGLRYAWHLALHAAKRLRTGQ